MAIIETSEGTEKKFEMRKNDASVATMILAVSIITITAPTSQVLAWNTLFTKRFECRLPILGAPMAGVSGGSLAHETCRAGGLGFIAAGHLNNQEAFDELEREIATFRDLSSSDESSSSSSRSLPLGIGFIGHSTFGKDSPGWEYVGRILEEHKPESVQVFAPTISTDLPSKLSAESSYHDNIGMCQSYGCRVIAQVGSVEDGIEALEAGVDCLIAQGTEAGG
jgi:nitronate monooxygenase